MSIYGVITESLCVTARRIEQAATTADEVAAAPAALSGAAAGAGCPELTRAVEELLVAWSWAAGVLGHRAHLLAALLAEAAALYDEAEWACAGSVDALLAPAAAGRSR